MARGLVVANATAAVLDDARQLASLLRTTASRDRRCRHAALARHLRTTGSLRGILMAPGELSEAAASRLRGRSALGGPGLRRAGLAGVDRGCRQAEDGGPLVAIVDYGLKSNIVQSMRRRGARVRILPHTISTSVALAPDIDEVILSPGPG